MSIGLSDITACPWNPRGEIARAAVGALAQSIKATGLLSPIVVWKRTDADGWYCVAGCRRLAAMKSIAGYAFDEGDYIEIEGTEDEARAITITENLQREGVNPIAEAKQVTALLDAGADERKVAAKFGKTIAWVRRRRKLAAITEHWAERSGELTVDALERIATYPAAVQERVFAQIKRLENCTTWRQLECYFNLESRDVDEAKFDRVECRKCLNRTGAEGDLFAVGDGKLGRCLDCQCFDRKLKEREDALIAAATEGASEVVRCKYEWQLPDGEDTSKKRDRRHRCAYATVNAHDEVTVVWAKSPAERERERARREEEARNENAERDAERRRLTSIRDRLRRLCSTNDEGECPDVIRARIDEEMARSEPSQAKAWIAEAALVAICEWHRDEEWAEMLEAFDWLAELADVSREDADHFIAVNGENNNENDNEE